MSSLWNVVVFIAIASCGLTFAALLVWIVLARSLRTKHKSAVVRLERVSVKRKLLLFLLFCSELIPETLVLAFSFVSGFVDLSLACFLFAVEFCSFSNSVLDHFGVKPPKQVYVVWARLFSCALGILVANFAAVLDHFDLGLKSPALVATLIFGVVVGLVLYCGILFAESKMEAHHQKVNPLPTLKKLLSKTRFEEFFFYPFLGILTKWSGKKCTIIWETKILTLLASILSTTLWPLSSMLAG
jgi:hypothetical protein